MSTMYSTHIVQGKVCIFNYKFNISQSKTLCFYNKHASIAVWEWYN